MDTSTIEVTGISEELLERLDNRVREQGRDRSQYIREIIEERLREDEKLPQSKDFEEILAPLQLDFEATGMTDEELGEFVDSEIRAYRAEKRAEALNERG